MTVSIAGIIVNVIMVILIMVVAAVGFTFNADLQTCENMPSFFCPTIECPCDVTPGEDPPAPCFGYAKRPAGKTGQWYCSNAPLTVVDNNGKVV
jgi:hypothetical protein